MAPKQDNNVATNEVTKAAEDPSPVFFNPSKDFEELERGLQNKFWIIRKVVYKPEIFGIWATEPKKQKKEAYGNALAKNMSEKLPID